MDNISQSDQPPAQDFRFQAPTFIDPLTGLFNRYYLYQFLPEEIKKAKLANYPLAVFMIDLDGFKQVNDKHGHLSGDKVLKQFSEIIKKHVRTTDAVIRYAGDEFVMLLPGAQPQRAMDVANKIVAAIDGFAFESAESARLHLSLSIGIAMYPDDHDDPNKLIDLADKALYLAKRRGKNRFCVAKDVTVEETSSMVAMDSFPCPVFVDRKEELGRLNNLFEVVAHSNILQIVFVSGDNGVGKTRLVKELSRMVKDNAIHIKADASLRHLQDPYYSFSQGIGHYIDGLGVDNLQLRNILLSLPAAELLELSLVIPQLAQVTKRPDNWQAQDRNTRFLLFKAYVDFIIELNKISAVLITIDDIQWLDKASLELLRYLAKQENNKRIYVVATYSEDKKRRLESQSDKGDVFEDIRYLNNFTEIELQNLTIEDSSLMIDAILKPLGAAADFVRMLQATTNGNAAFIEEILKVLVENGSVYYQRGCWQVKPDLASGDIPSSPEDITKLRLKNLDAETKEMIIQAAVIGEDFQIDTLKKMGNKDDGLVFDLLNRAKKMRLVDEQAAGGKFNFVNKNIQNALYNQIDVQARNDLHYRIGQALTEENKDNLYNVAGEAAFHFSQATHKDESRQYSKMLLEKTFDLFSPREALGYLGALAQDIIAEQKPAVEVSDELMRQTGRFIRALQGALKNFRLYPALSAIRVTAVKEAWDILTAVLNEAERVDICEVEKSLVINRKRVLPKDLQEGSLDTFLIIMMDYNLKSVSFLRGVKEAELNNFVQYLSQDYQEVVKRGGWADMLKKEGIEYIHIDTVRFMAQGETGAAFDQKKKAHDMMLMEFLLGKIDGEKVDRNDLISTLRTSPKKVAQMILSAAKSGSDSSGAQNIAQAISQSISKIQSQIAFPQNSGGYAKDMAKVILELEPMATKQNDAGQSAKPLPPGEKGALEGMTRELSDDVMADVLLEKYRACNRNLTALKEFSDQTITDTARKNTILSKLAARAQADNLGIDQEALGFLTQQISWEDLSIEKKVEGVFLTPPDGPPTIDLAKVKELLKGLDSRRKRGDIKRAIQALLARGAGLEHKVKQSLLTTCSDYFREYLVSPPEDAAISALRIDAFYEAFRDEADTKVFASLIDIFKQLLSTFVSHWDQSRDAILVSEDAVLKRYFYMNNKVLSALSGHLKLGPGLSAPNQQLAKNCINDIFKPPLLEMLVYSIINCKPEEQLFVAEIAAQAGNSLIDTLVDLGTEKHAQLKDPFRKYVVQKRIASLLEFLKATAVNRLNELLSGDRKNLTASLVEFVGYVKDEGILDSLSSLAGHRDPAIRTAVVLSLREIGSPRSADILGVIVKDERDKRIRQIAKDQLKFLKDALSNK